MAALIKDSRARSPYWICCYTTADGRRLKKSTKKEDRAEALEVCLALERAEKFAKNGTLTEARARQLIGEVVERATGEQLAFYTVEGWFSEWLRGKEVSKAGSTHTKYQQTTDEFLNLLGGRSKLNIAAITSKDISRFRDAQLASGKSPNTVRYAVKQLRIPFNAARRAGVIPTNPAEAVELPSKAEAQDGGEASREAFTGEQMTALLNVTFAKTDHGKPVFVDGQEWHGTILFAYFTGARLKDVTNMVWSSIDLPSKTITYRAQKTDKVVTIPIHPELESYLLECPAPDSGRAFLFPALAAKGTGGRSGLSMTFARIMARAGVAGTVTRKANGKGRTVRTLSFHSIRHSFNSAMANAGVSQEVRMKLTGHASVEMNKGYTHHELAPLRTAIKAIPGLAS